MGVFLNSEGQTIFSVLGLYLTIKDLLIYIMYSITIYSIIQILYLNSELKFQKKLLVNVIGNYRRHPSSDGDKWSHPSDSGEASTGAHEWGKLSLEAIRDAGIHVRHPVNRQLLFKRLTEGCETPEGRQTLIYRQCRLAFEGSSAWRDVGSDFIAACRTRLNFPRVVSGVLVMIGLLGTLYGLIATVTNMHGVIDQAKQSMVVGDVYEGVIEGFSRALGGMDTAFETTRAGLLSAVVLLFFLGYSEGRQRKISNDSSVLIVEQIVPLFKTVEDQSSMEAFFGRVEEQIAHMNGASEKLFKTSQLIMGATEKFEGFSGLFQKGAESIISFNSEIGKYLEALQRATGRIGEVAESLNASNSTMTSEISSAITAFTSTSDGIRLQFAEMSVNLEQKIDSMIAERNSLGDAVKSLETALAFNRDSVKAMTERLPEHFQIKLDEVFEVFTPKLEKALSQLGSEGGELSRAAQSFRETLELNRKEMWQLGTRIAQETERNLTDIGTRFKDQLTEALRENRQEISGVFARENEIVGALAEFLVAANDYIRRIAEAMRGIEQAVVPEAGLRPKRIGKPKGFDGRIS